MYSFLCITALFFSCKPDISKPKEDFFCHNQAIRSSIYGVELGSSKQKCVDEFARYGFQIKYDEDTLVCFQKGASRQCFMYEGRYYRYLYAYVKNQKVEAIEFSGAFPYEQANVVFNKGKKYYTKHYHLCKQVDDTDTDGKAVRYIMARDKDHKHYFCYALLPAIDENGNHTYTITLTYKLK